MIIEIPEQTMAPVQEMDPVLEVEDRQVRVRWRSSWPYPKSQPNGGYMCLSFRHWERFRLHTSMQPSLIIS